MPVQHLLKLIDAAAEILPTKTSHQSNSPKLVGHRGGSGPGKEENTLESFDACVAAKVWGIEADLRWTKDNVPVISHDDSAQRIFGVPTVISESTFAQLRSRIAKLPTLAELVQKAGRKCHLMIEVKQPLTDERLESFRAATVGLEAVRDYHLLTLNPKFLASTQLTKRSFIFVTEYHPLKTSKFALEQGWGGVAGHYLLLSPALRARHHRAGQLTGVGFVNGINNVYRQSNSRADWIFSDQAVQLQRRLDHSAGPG